MILRLWVARSALVLLTLVVPSHAQAPLPPDTRRPALGLGAAWYPEQWPENWWDADLTLMEKAHLNFVRVGEFAWSTIEPHEGEFHLEWLQHAVRAAERHHIAVVIGTPSAAPPAWLTQKYPDTLRTMENGRKDGHGNRQQFDWSDPKYRELSRRVAEKMARAFGHDANVIGCRLTMSMRMRVTGQARRRNFKAGFVRSMGLWKI